MQNLVARKTNPVKYRLDKSKLPVGTTSVHYVAPVDVNGVKTQDIPVGELEANPAKYYNMFPQYIEKIRTNNTVTIKPVNREFKVVGGVVVKKTAKRTVDDIAENISFEINGKAVEKKAAKPESKKEVPTGETKEELPFGDESGITPKRRK